MSVPADEKYLGRRIKMEKFCFGFATFYLLDKTVTLKESGVKIELKNEEGEKIKLLFGLAHTPRTYYSGWKPIVTMAVDVPESKYFLEKDFGSGINAEAEIEALSWNPLLRLPSWGGNCKAFKVFTDDIVENELCKISGIVPEGKKYEISCVEKANKEEYIQVVTSLELMSSERENLLFSGWKRPTNLIQNGEWEIRKDETFGIFYATKSSSPIDALEVTSIIEEHLKKLGY